MLVFPEISYNTKDKLINSESFNFVSINEKQTKKMHVKVKLSKTTN